MIEMLLAKAGYTKDLTWQCRIDKMKHCDSISPPIRVIGYKDFGVYMRVKPGANDTKDHQMTLLIPDGSGYSAENLFNQLKGCCKSISRSWRQDLRTAKVEAVPEVTPSSAPAQPAEVSEPPAEVPVQAPPMPSIPLAIREETVEEIDDGVEDQQAELDFSTLRGIVNKPDKLKFVLERIRQIGSRARTKLEFIKTLQVECDWTHHLPRTVSRVISELEKFEYIQEVRSGVAITGYDLTPTGLALAESRPVHHVPPAPEPEEAVDHGLLLRQFTSRAQELADIGRRLEAIEDQRADLRKQLGALDEEYDRLAATIKDKEFPPAIKRLMGIKEMPMKGVKS